MFKDFVTILIGVIGKQIGIIIKIRDARKLPDVTQDEAEHVQRIEPKYL